MPGQDLVLYDGVCGLCNSLVQFVLPRDEAGTFDFASLQSETGQSWLRRFGLSTADLDTMVVVTGYRGDQPRPLSRARAALYVLQRLRGPWRTAALAGILPDAMLNRGYDFIARRRYRWFGQSDRCVVLPPHHRARVIDV